MGSDTGSARGSLPLALGAVGTPASGYRGAEWDLQAEWVPRRQVAARLSDRGAALYAWLVGFGALARRGEAGAHESGEITFEQEICDDSGVQTPNEWRIKTWLE